MRSSLGVVLIATVLAVSGCGTTRVPPPADATAHVVARAYLEALVAGDCTATAALLTNGDPAGRDLCGVGHVDAYRDLSGPAGTATDVSFFVSLTLRDMPRTAGWADGEAGVFLNLVRQPAGPWRVTGVNSGP
jgi:hypothetical protein